MEHVQNDIDLQVDNPTKNTNLIEWNVDMKVTVSNVKKSKMFQRSRSIVLFLVAIIFAIMLSHLRKEVRGLQVQMQCINVNLLLLMSKYDRLNRSLNRAWIQRSEGYLESKNMHDVKRLLEGASSTLKATKVFDDIHKSNRSSYTYNSVVSYLNSRSLQNRNDNVNVNKSNESTIPKSLVQLNDNGNVVQINDGTNLRIERAILTIENQNLTEKDAQSSQKRIDESNDNDYVDDDVDIWREPRSGRWRRDEGRGKKRGKNKRRPKRSRRRLGPLVATFVGAIPEQHVTDTVYIGPWVKSTKNNTIYSLNKFHLVEDKKSIEVTVTGLYMISAQIFYFGEPTNYSYWILLSSEGKSTTRKLVKCSTASSMSATEVSCYTSVITPLERGDRVHIQQQEKNRLINMREGHSYIQLVLLSNNTNHKRRAR
ncbi:uncharacterized protein LOC100877939 isoform X1 [Megachile rotundata]|uniref:uncharacterized protein LOC100877939 isoform X1 n=1 Tax=Megachile rotundata TaxID=143995 RepID=UPI000614E1BB|nr:PREDICTED: uncharacterized protein LOC100877939 isoform X1 [Megachile rotundata]XP_012135223.1 PREDICTED: uncharacterized protein LOC100877939 isoform X1 [Megachile rotundata]XP_012135226.1 PREDICTED: uncharacterized protein LOC100877939 isoform X1 [Megachile rotundata]